MKKAVRCLTYFLFEACLLEEEVLTGKLGLVGRVLVLQTQVYFQECKEMTCCVAADS